MSKAITAYEGSIDDVVINGVVINDEKTELLDELAGRKQKLQRPR